MSERETLHSSADQSTEPQIVTPPNRVVLRGGVGPEQPEWDDVQTYSAEWYRRFRDWHRAEFPDADATTRDNLDMLVKAAR